MKKKAKNISKIGTLSLNFGDNCGKSELSHLFRETIVVGLKLNRKKKKERHLKRWNDEFKMFHKLIAGNEWTRISKRKSKWKKLGEAYAQNGTGTI